MSEITCDEIGICVADCHARNITNCIHCGKELHYRYDGADGAGWYTWDASIDGGLKQLVSATAPSASAVPS